MYTKYITQIIFKYFEIIFSRIHEINVEILKYENE